MRAVVRRGGAALNNEVRNAASNDGDADHAQKLDMRNSFQKLMIPSSANLHQCLGMTHGPCGYSPFCVAALRLRIQKPKGLRAAGFGG